MQAARTRVGGVTGWLSTYVPDPDSAPDMQAVLEAMASVIELEAAIRRVTGTANDAAVQRAAEMISLDPHLGQLLQLILTSPDPLGDELTTATRTARALLGESAQPRSAQEGVDTAQRVANQVDALRRAVERALTLAAGQLPARVTAAQQLPGGIGIPQLLSPGERGHLVAFTASSRLRRTLTLPPWTLTWCARA